jgi:hypothetical protein
LVVFTLWVSITEAVGSGLRPSFTRARPVRLVDLGQLGWS